MATPPTAKRRRLNDALHKPFKSPLRAPFKPNANPFVASPLSSTSSKFTNDSTNPSENASVAAFPAPRGIKCNVASTTPKPVQSFPTDPTTHLAIQTTSKEIRRLESSAIKARQDLDTLQQALSIVQSTKGVELEALTVKWRQAARAAAEEVFAGARDKVNRMGGVGAWRERENEKKSFGDQWEREPERNRDPDTDDEEREGTVYERDERVVEDDWAYDREDQAEKEELAGRDDDSFTMDMMLKTLNIELDLIGYDRHRQTWVG